MKSKGKVKIVEAGYTVTVVSWENDADNYQTNSVTVDTLEEAEALYNLMQLCTSKNNQPKGVVRLGNTYGEFNGPQIDLIIDFLKANPALYQEVDYEFGLDDDDDDVYMDIFFEISTDLLGSSEDYACRVMSSCEVTYCPEPIYADKIF